MLHGRGGATKYYYSSACSFLTRKTVTTTATIGSKLGNVLLVASIAKALSGSGGTGNLDGDSIPLSECIVLQVLQRSSLEASKKVDFFRWCSLKPNYKHTADTYSQILRTLCYHHHPLHEILQTLTSMKQDGVKLDSATFKLLLEFFIRQGKFDYALEILNHVEKEMEMVSSNSSVNLDVYNSVLVALVRKGQLALVLSIFFNLLDASNVNSNGNESGSGYGVFPKAIVCNELLVSLKKADKRTEFKRVFDKLRERNIFPMDLRGYNICIHAFGCWGDLATSLSLFKEMKEKNPGTSGSCSPDLCTYNSLIHVLCLVGRVKDALVAWEELKDSAHQPDAFTYRILIQGCCKSYLMEDAKKIFSEMQYNGLRPDAIVYNSLLDGLLKARKLTEACQLFERMVDDGVRTSCWTHNILIDGLFRNGRAAAGYSLFCDLKKKGQFVDGITYSIVTLHLCKESLVDEALQLVEEMEARGFVVDLVTITSVLIALHKQSRWDGTERLMKHIRDGNLVPTVLKWKGNMEESLQNPQNRPQDFTPIVPSKGDLNKIMTLISSSESGNNVGSSHGGESQDDETDQWSSSPYMDKLAKQVNSDNNCNKVFSMARGMRVEEEGLDSFDMDMVNTYLSIFLAKGKLSLACKLFKIFTNMGVDPVSYTYNSIMSSFVKKGYFNEAWGVLHEMDDKVCPADIATYNVIIQGLGKMGRADLSSAVLDNLIKQGGYLDIVMYNTLINALGKAGRIDEVNKFFEQMRTSGINPDVVSYNTLIEVHSKAGRLKDAYKFLKMMLDAGCAPNHVTDTTLDFLEKEIEKLRYQKASIRRANKDDDFL